MKKIIAITLAALIAALALVSCGKEETEAPLGFIEISSDDVTYDLFVPDEWTPDLSTGVTSAYYSGQDPSNISLMAFELDGTVTSIEDYWKKYEPSLKAVLPDLAYEGEPELDKLDGVDAVQYTYTATMSGTAYKFIQIVAFKDNTAYIFTYTAAADKFDTHIEDVVEMLVNFKFH